MGHETLYWVGETHADLATGAVGGAPYGPRNVVLGGGNACGLCQWGLRCSSLWGHGSVGLPMGPPRGA
eukprot:290207-Pyramimonas_sp.AAC.1